MGAAIVLVLFILLVIILVGSWSYRERRLEELERLDLGFSRF
ncbi:hypothetical protein VQL36_14395 [Chengkuizengella sp. SCS-71B]